MITIIKLPKKSGLRTVLFRRTLYEQQNEDRKRVHAEAQRVYRHDARKRSELLENSIDPDDPYSADAAHRNKRRRQRYTVTSHIAAHDIVEEREKVRRRYKQNADISYLDYLRFRREYGDHALATQEQHRHHKPFDDNAFQKTELQSLLASVRLPRTVILAGEGSACLTEAVENII